MAYIRYTVTLTALRMPASPDHMAVRFHKMSCYGVTVMPRTADIHKISLSSPVQ